MSEKEDYKSKPYKKGDKLIVEITITDEEKSFDFLVKALYGKTDTSDLGFTVDLVSFWKDRYIDNIPNELSNEINNILLNATDRIKNLLIKGE